MMRLPVPSHERGLRYFIRSANTTARQVPYTATSDNTCRLGPIYKLLYRNVLCAIYKLVPVRTSSPAADLAIII